MIRTTAVWMELPRARGGSDVTSGASGVHSASYSRWGHWAEPQGGEVNHRAVVCIVSREWDMWGSRAQMRSIQHPNILGSSILTISFTRPRLKV